MSFLASFYTVAPTVLTSEIESLVWDVFLASCWLKWPEKEAQKQKKKKTHRNSFLNFILFFHFCYLGFFSKDIFPPLRTFHDFIGFKSVFALLTWILITTGKSFFQMPHTQTRRHTLTLKHVRTMLFNFFSYWNFTLSAQNSLYLKEAISIDITPKYNI